MKLISIMESELGFSSFFSIKSKINIKDFKKQARILIKSKKMIALKSEDAELFIKTYGKIIHLPSFDFHTIIYVHESIIEKFIIQEKRPTNFLEIKDFDLKIKNFWNEFLNQYEVYKKNTDITAIMLSIGIAI